MMRNLFLMFFLVLFSALSAQTTTSILNASSPDEYRWLKEKRLTITENGDTIQNEKKPLDYGYVDPKDIIWAQVVWEIIDLNEKLNQPYFYSSDGITNNSPSLFQALKNGVDKGEIDAIYEDEYFKNKVSWDDVKSSFSFRKPVGGDYCDELKELDSIAYETECFDTYEIFSEDIRFFKVKGMWYVDKRLGEMRYRILGLAPMGPDLEFLASDAAAELDRLKAATSGAGVVADTAQGDDSDDPFADDDDPFSDDPFAEEVEEDEKGEEGADLAEKLDEKVNNLAIREGASEELLDLFWVFYPSSRLTLHNYDVFSPENLAATISFDDMLNARRFSSVIYKIEDGRNKELSKRFPSSWDMIDYDRQFREKILEKENIMWNY